MTNNMQKNKEIIDRIPWIEKYRPRTIEQLILDDSLFNKVKQIIDSKEMPNIIITGIPGVGKTTTIKCIAKGLYGKHLNSSILEINASDDRGSKTVEEIQNFCNRKLDLNDDGKKDYADHKLVFLDEADNITHSAQMQISNLMKKYEHNTRFAFTSNESSEIIESIQSNCIILKYNRVSDAKIIEKLKFIAHIENVNYDDEGIESIAFISQGDIRSSINALQRVHVGAGKVNKTNVYEVCDKPQPVIINSLFKFCVDKDVVSAIKIVEQLRENGFSDSDIVLSMLSSLKVSNLNINEDIKIKFAKVIGHSAYIISKGLDKPLQSTACIASMILSLYEPSKYPSVKK